MSLQCIKNRYFLCRHIINGACDLSLPVKGVQAAAVGRIIHGILIDIIIVHRLGTFLSHYQHAVFRQALIGILRHKIRIQHRVPGLYGDMRRKSFISLQKLQKRRVLAALLGDQVKGHVLVKIGQNFCGLLSCGKKLLIADVIFQIL